MPSYWYYTRREGYSRRSLIGLNKGRYMNSWDLLIVIGVTAIGVGFIRASYTLGYREGHSEGYLRGRAIAKALKDKEAAR